MMTKHQTKLEKKLERIQSPFSKFTESQTSSFILLVIATVLALLWASTPAVAPWYDRFTHLSLGLHLGPFATRMSLKFFVNDILLALFFFLIGLEIKREFLVGELTNHRRSLFIIAGALGGMVVPASLYAFLNLGHTAIHGWGIPMATDTAFAIGILSAFKDRLPKGVFTFLAALAILDDIGAILVIALFYSDGIHLIYLGFGLVFELLLWLLNYAGVRHALPYFVTAIFVWYFIHQAGIHGAIVGVLIALTVPARPKKPAKKFIKQSLDLLKDFKERKRQKRAVLKDAEQHRVLEKIRLAAEQASTPLQRWEAALENSVGLLILPLFALLNAGVPVRFALFNNVYTHDAGLGILLGLLLGKPIGIIGFSYLSLRLRISRLPQKTHFKHIIPAALMAGIGFAMSLFIANLAFVDNPLLLQTAKASILSTSLIVALIAVSYLTWLVKK